MRPSDATRIGCRKGEPRSLGRWSSFRLCWISDASARARAYKLDPIRPLAGRRSDDHAEPPAVVPINVPRPDVVNRRDRSLGADPEAAIGVGLAEAKESDRLASSLAPRRSALQAEG